MNELSLFPLGDTKVRKPHERVCSAEEYFQVIFGSLASLNF